MSWKPGDPREPDGKFGYKGGADHSGEHASQTASQTGGRGYDAERRSEALGAKSASQLHKWLDGKKPSEVIAGVASKQAAKTISRMVIKSIVTHLVTQSVAMADALIAHAVESALGKVGEKARGVAGRSMLAQTIKHLYEARMAEAETDTSMSAAKAAAKSAVSKNVFDQQSRAWAAKNPDWKAKYGKPGN